MKLLFALVTTLVSATGISLTSAHAKANPPANAPAKPRAPEVPYPEGYRRWVHVSSQLIGPGSPMHASVGGLHHVYANEQAMNGLPTGRYEDGSVFVFDVLNVSTVNDVTSATTRRLLDVMVRDSVRFAETGGWGFEEFRGGTKERILEAPRRAQCARCHATRKAAGQIFSSVPL